MVDESIYFIILISTFSFIIIHFVHISIFNTINVFRLIGYGLLNYFIFNIILYHYFNHIFFDYLLIYMVIYLCFSVVYIHLFMAMDRSVSVRILCEINTSSNKSITTNDIFKVYNVNEMFKKRLSYLHVIGWVELLNDKYKCSKKGRKIASITFHLQNLYNLHNIG